MSMPSWELFEAQTSEYRDSVPPAAAIARVSVEPVSPFGWERCVGFAGAIIGVGHFGASNDEVRSMMSRALWSTDAALAGILGFTKRGECLRIDPWVPTVWHDFAIEYRYGSRIQRMRCVNRVCQSWVVSVAADGQQADDGALKLADDGASHEVGVRREVADVRDNGLLEHALCLRFEISATFVRSRPMRRVCRQARRLLGSRGGCARLKLRT